MINLVPQNIIPIIDHGCVVLVVTDVRAHVAPGSNVLRTAVIRGWDR